MPENIEVEIVPTKTRKFRISPVTLALSAAVAGLIVLNRVQAQGETDTDETPDA